MLMVTFILLLMFTRLSKLLLLVKSCIYLNIYGCFKVLSLTIKVSI